MAGGLKELTTAVAVTTGKPEPYVVVHVVTDQVQAG